MSGNTAAIPFSTPLMLTSMILPQSSTFIAFIGDTGIFLAVSVDLPLLGQVVEAGAERPYLCLQIELDSRQIGELIAQSGEPAFSRGDTTRRGVFVGTPDSLT